MKFQGLYTPRCTNKAICNGVKVISPLDFPVKFVFNFFYVDWTLCSERKHVVD